MPYSIKQNLPLSREERKKLLLVLREMEVRGITIPDEYKSLLEQKKQEVWPLDDNGYFVGNDGSRFVPYESQEAFIKSNSRFVLFAGGRGSGKSGAGAQKALLKIMQGKSGAVLNPDFENFKISTWPELKKWIPWSMVVPNQLNRRLPSWQPMGPFTMVFTNGAKMLCKGLRDPNSARGPNINWLWYDEAGVDKTGESWQIANASVRIGKDTQSWCTTTPKGTSHWLYKFFVLEDIPEEARKMFDEVTSGRKLIEYFRGGIAMNKDNLDPAFYASMLAQYPAGYLREQELNGEFANEGAQLGNSDWFVRGNKIIEQLAEDMEINASCRYWDMAATEKKVGMDKNDPDEAVGTLVHRLHPRGDGLYKEHDFVIADQIGGFFAWERLKALIAETARRDGELVTVVIEQEPGSGGKNQVAEIQAYFKTFPELANHRVVPQRPTDRVIEAQTWFGYAAAGRVYMLKNLAWNAKFLDQLDGFLLVKHDDRVTSASGAFRYLSPWKTWKRVDFLSV